VNRTAFRFYNQYAMPEEYATREITVRLHNNAHDAERGLKNRAHHLRAIPPGDPDFDGLYARRVDAESMNRQLEDTLFLKKAHSVGHLRQESDMLGFALMVNAVTRARHREQQRLLAA
jgi:hypothetical protein